MRYTLTIVKSPMTLIWCSCHLNALSCSCCSPHLSITFTIPTTPLTLILFDPPRLFHVHEHSLWPPYLICRSAVPSQAQITSEMCPSLCASICFILAKYACMPLAMQFTDYRLDPLLSRVSDPFPNPAIVGNQIASIRILTQMTASFSQWVSMHYHSHCRVFFSFL